MYSAILVLKTCSKAGVTNSCCNSFSIGMENGGLSLQRNGLKYDTHGVSFAFRCQYCFWKPVLILFWLKGCD